MSSGVRGGPWAPESENGAGVLVLGCSVSWLCFHPASDWWQVVLWESHIFSLSLSLFLSSLSPSLWMCISLSLCMCVFKDYMDGTFRSEVKINHDLGCRDILIYILYGYISGVISHSICLLEVQKLIGGHVGRSNVKAQASPGRLFLPCVCSSV